MRILFLGGTGNISTECASLLYERGHQIIVLSRGQSAVPTQYTGILADRKDSTAMRSAVGGLRPEVVINFLGYELADVQTDFALFSGIVRQYIFISSATVYAKPPVRLPITEESPLGNAWWDYAQKKLACEQWLLEQHRSSGFPVTIVRPSHTYSKRWVPNPVSSASYTFAARIEQNRPLFVPDLGQNPWTLTAATDFAVGLEGLVGNEMSFGEPFHITSDEVLTWDQIYSEIAAALNKALPLVFQIPTEFICQVAPHLTGNLKGDKAHPGIFDNTKIKRFNPSFKCRKSFSAGIQESIQWLRQHPEHQKLNSELDATFEKVIAAWKQTEK